jgi:hypothetical protein
MDMFWQPFRETKFDFQFIPFPGFEQLKNVWNTSFGDLNFLVENWRIIEGYLTGLSLNTFTASEQLF